MLEHSEANLNKKEKVKICKNAFYNDGYNNDFRIRA